VAAENIVMMKLNFIIPSYICNLYRILVVIGEKLKKRHGKQTKAFVLAMQTL